VCTVCYFSAHSDTVEGLHLLLRNVCYENEECKMIRCLKNVFLQFLYVFYL
jgi:hypothetical protein